VREIANYIRDRDNNYKGAFMRVIKLLSVISILILLMLHFVSAAENKHKIRSEIPTEIKAKVTTICQQPKLVTESELDNDMRKYRDENHLAYNTVIHTDLNGDKLLDWAFLVKCNSKENKSIVEKLVSLIQKQSGDYDIYVLEEFPELRSDVYLMEIPPKKIKDFDSNAIVKIKYKGIERIFDEKSSGIYFWDDTKFRYVQTSD